jgi:dolichol-phosphate mannosyltransferase
MDEICVIVPSLNPDEQFLNVIKLLIDRGFKRILIVDDGSKSECEPFFAQAGLNPECTIIRHYRNLGKGRALKSAINYYLTHFPELKGVVAVDADNQHHIDDIVSCAQSMLLHPDSLVLGCRNFFEPGVPRKSRIGNLITAWVFRFLCGIRVSDTQTGLRAMSNSIAEQFLDLAGERFEYETNMLIETKKRMIPIQEVVIKTVYIEKNESSHFNPLRDSVRIYLLIIKFLSASSASFVIDLGIFAGIMMLLTDSSLEWKVTLATLAARIFSSVFNYSMNRNFVFQSKHAVSRSIKRYYLLAVVQMILSMGGVYLLTLWLGINSTVLKAGVDFILFLVGFQIQREWVFARNKDRLDQ